MGRADRQDKWVGKTGRGEGECFPNKSAIGSRLGKSLTQNEGPIYHDTVGPPLVTEVCGGTMVWPEPFVTSGQGGRKKPFTERFHVFTFRDSSQG